MRFYVLKKPRAGSPQDKEAGTEALPEEGFNVGEPRKCELCGRYTSMLPWLPPYRVELETWGREFGDLAFGVADDLVVSGRFKEFYERNHLSGLVGLAPVEIMKLIRHRKLAGDPPPYFKGSVVYSQTAVDLVASGFEWEEKPTCPACRQGKDLKRWQRIVIESGTWTGEDIFIARGLPGGFITSSRFKEVCDANEVKSAVFVPAEDYAYDFYPWEKAS